MSKQWKNDKLSNLCHRIGDGLHGTPVYSKKRYFYFINGNNLKNGKIEINNETKAVIEEDYVNNFIELNKNTLLIGINGTIGNMAFYNNEKVMLGKSAAYLNFKTDINRFYYYFFQLNKVQKYFYNVATGSTIKNLSLQSLQNFYVPVPERIEWEKIAAVLSALDAKIELNNRINAELEAMAKTLYDYWFVQFDFPFDFAQGKPDENGKPYKSSGGKMVYNAELKREIPVGWEVKVFKHLATPINENIDSNEYIELPYLPIDKLPIKKLYYDEYESREEANSSLIKFKEDDILLGAMRVYFHRVCNAIEDGISRSTIMVIRPLNSTYKNFLLFALNRNEAIEFATKNSTGSSIPYAKWIGGIEKYKVCLNKDENLFLKFNKIINPILEKFKILSKQNQQLKELRDFLLPMLMNGQVSVK